MFPEPYYQGKPSNHFDGKKFFYPNKDFRHNFAKVLKWRLFDHHPVWPHHVPSLHVKDPVERIEDQVRITYIGHATLLIQAAGLNILLDPHFSARASPFKWMGFKRVQKPGIPLSRLPFIDAVFISHDHYDHLDIFSLRKIWKRDHPLVITPLGNDKIIKRVHKGIKIKTLDWGETFEMSSRFSLKVLPSQHWSARTLFDRNFALWSSALLNFDEKTIFFMGDSGFDAALFAYLKKTIGKNLDIAIMPIGSYEPRWLMSYAHMNPEEAWEAFKILDGQHILPIHYDIFPLGDEPYGSALPRLLKAAGEQRNKVIPLKAGEHFDLP